MNFKPLNLPLYDRVIFRAFIDRSYPLTVTREMKKLAIETPYSLHDIAYLKYYCNLTDYGLKQVLEIACQNGISVWSVIEAANI